MTRRMFAAFVFLLCVLVVTQPSWSQRHSDVYFVAIGSSAYAPARSAESQGMSSPLGMNKSARLLADHLVRGGARFGVQLTSGQGEFVTVQDMQLAIARVAKAIEADRSTSPLLLFYFGGHGITEGVGWNYFAVPGDFTYRPPLRQLPIESLAARTLYAAALIETLDKVGVPYVVLLDTCYEGTEAKFESPILSGPAIESLRNIAGVIRAFNEFRQESPVLFSTRPGTTVETVLDPTDSGPDRVGPLARRALIALDAAARGRKDMSLAAFVQQMTSPVLDSASRPAVTLAKPGDSWSRILYAFQAAAGTTEERRGSAHEAAEPCCSSVGIVAPKKRSYSGRVNLVGAQGEYITDGRTIQLTDQTAAITAALTGVDQVTIAADVAGDTWEIAFSMPDRKQVATGRYRDAERQDFAAAGSPGLAITGPGRACNEVKGEFTINEVASTADGSLQRLRGTFVQYCDDNKAPLRATVDIRSQ